MADAGKNRRQVLRSAAGAAAAAALWPLPSIAQAAPRIVVVGGGFAGASCARALRNADGRLAVTLVERRRMYTAPPLSNAVLGGLRALADQQFGYQKIAAAGINVVYAAATAVDPQARSVTLGTGDKLSYDRLVLAPGIALRFDALPGYSEAVAETAAACLDRGRRADRDSYGVRSRRWRTAVWWRSRCPPIRRAARPDRTSGRA